MKAIGDVKNRCCYVYRGETKEELAEILLIDDVVKAESLPVRGTIQVPNDVTPDGWIRSVKDRFGDWHVAFFDGSRSAELESFYMSYEIEYMLNLYACKYGRRPEEEYGRPDWELLGWLAGKTKGLSEDDEMAEKEEPLHFPHYGHMVPKDVIFLDFDGVLNKDGTRDRTPNGYIGLDLELLERFARLVSKPDRLVVLTTSWKMFYNRPEQDDLRYALRKLKSIGVNTVSATKEARWADRSLGILNWLCDHPHKNWVVLDDEWFVGYSDVIGSHLVATVSSSGLTEDDLNRAEKILQTDTDDDDDVQIYVHQPKRWRNGR